MTIVIPDVHGDLELLDAALALHPDREFIFLGDLIDRGPDSPGVIRRVQELQAQGRVRAVLWGNHEHMMVAGVVAHNTHMMDMWLQNGGAATVEQYALAPEGTFGADIEWLMDTCVHYYVEGSGLFAHALRPTLLAMSLLPDPHSPVDARHLWGRPEDGLGDLPGGLEYSAHGHTPQRHPGWNSTRTAALLDSTGRRLALLDTRTRRVEQVSL